MRKSDAVPPDVKLKSVRGQLITINEASKITRLGKDWFYRHMKNGTLPFPWRMQSVCNRVIDSADLDDWLNVIKIPVGRKPENNKGGAMRKL
jgi:predicted DNA-binding transcriptional regulator AlpA